MAGLGCSIPRLAMPVQVTQHPEFRAVVDLLVKRLPVPGHLSQSLRAVARCRATADSGFLRSIQ